MSDFARLEDKLAKLRQRERTSGEGRKLRGDTAERLLAALVTEIDETILPRRLIFAVSDGPTLQIAVANRRLQALLSPVPKLVGGEAGKLADQPLADADDPNLTALRKVVLATFASAAPVSIQSERLTSPTFGSDIGVPSTQLARAWNVTETEQVARTPAEIVAEFLQKSGDSVLAWLRIEGEAVTDQGGDAGLLQSLGDQAAVFLDGYFSKLETLFADEGASLATLIAPIGGAGPAVLFIEMAELSMFIAAQPDRAAALATRWQSLTVR